jgi:cob(I)alamin adenosyltransferase
MRIYTRTGDEGMTSLFGGQRLSKDDQRIEAYGTLDELNALLGALGDHECVAQNAEHIDFLRTLQSDLFTWGSHLATTDPDMLQRLPTIPTTRLDEMEKWMDRQSEPLPELKQFVIPGGHHAVSAAHLCRVVCRRAERRVIGLSKVESIPPLLIAYLNRLSDVFFIWSRALSETLEVAEIPWKPES